MNTKWLCNKCHSWNGGDKTRCSFCSEPRPVQDAQSEMTAPEAVADDKLTQQLHNIVEKLTPIQKKKLYRWLEDNVL